MQNATTMKSGEDTPVPAAVSRAEADVVKPEPDTVREAAPMLAPEPDTVSQAVPAVVAPEPAATNEVEPEEVTQPVSVIEAATEEAPQQGAVVSAAPADGDGKIPSPAPVSPSTVTERQIPVDPTSLHRLGMVADEDSPLSAPSVLTEVVVQSPLLPPLRRPTFVGASLPCSAVSSPVLGGAVAKWEESNSNPTATPSPRSALSSLARQHSAALARLVSAPLALARSASRAEGRAMSPHDDDEEPNALAAEDGSFTCGALCMLIPGFSRKKPAAGMAVSSMQRQPTRVASLERFECGSWSPPPPVKMAFVFDDGEVPTRGILKNSASSRLSSARPSSSSQRHVRFSTAATSCPSSPLGVVTPRARAEFNAFLEAQSA
jgi:hypothetical protein